MADDVFLRMESAIARIADELQRVTASGPSPLRGVDYSTEARALWRWVGAPEDADVWAFVRAYAGAADRDRVRSSLTLDDFYTLMTFARRCVLAALRNEDPGAAEAAFDALSIIDLERFDRRDVLLTASMASYAARRVGLLADEVLAGAVRLAQSAVAEILERAVTQDIDLVGDWSYREVATAAGPVLIRSDSQPLNDELLFRALTVAELVENDGNYTVTDVNELAELPSMWLGDDVEVRAARKRLLGCVRFHAETPKHISRHTLMVFLVEAADDRDAEVIAAAARRRSDDNTAYIGVVVGAQCTVVVARSSAVNEPPIEDPESLARLAGPISVLLKRPPTPVQELAVQIYLESADGASAVDRSVLDVLRELNADVGVRPPPVIGSWWRGFKATMKKVAETEPLSDLALRLERVLEIQTLHGPQAQIDAAQAGAAADLIKSLEGQRNALVQIGSLLLIKLDGDLIVRNLTQRELAFIQRNPSSATNAREILEQLQKLGTDHTRTTPINESTAAKPSVGQHETASNHAALTCHGRTSGGLHKLIVTNSGRAPVRNIRATVEGSTNHHSFHVSEDNIPISQIMPGQSAILNIVEKVDTNPISVTLRGEDLTGEAIECVIEVTF